MASPRESGPNSANHRSNDFNEVAEAFAAQTPGFFPGRELARGVQ